VKHAIFVAPFEELSDPRIVAELAAEAEAAGWDGFFLWDHIRHAPPVRALADAWVTLAAMAATTTQIRLGPMVTPLSRRRVHKVARETVSLDLLSNGRLTLGVGLGAVGTGELAEFGEVTDARERAKLLDQGLADLTRYWGGEFEPVPVQRPRIPVWVAGEWPHRKPLQRAARWDGLFPIRLPGPDALAELAAEVRAARPPGAPFDFAVDVPPGTDPAPWEAAGATWMLTGLGRTPTRAQVSKVINAAP
jgi:alkanesulfonate monooxygenase SsuD/methylene tetrahydromethanopterin reductase-like flavin-dependent oxidoreductase (luciferase family)